MNGDLIVWGVYIHPLIIAAMIALPLGGVAAWVLERVGFYRFVWHRGLFDIAMTFSIWVGVAALLGGIARPGGIYG